MAIALRLEAHFPSGGLLFYHLCVCARGVTPRIITTADIFDALTAERPYRAAMPITKALAIMSGMVGTQIDANCFATLTRALGRIDETLAA